MTIKLWGLDSGQCKRTLQGQQAAVGTVAFRPDGRVLATGGTDRTVRIWDAETGRYIYTLEESDFRVPYVRFSPDGRLLASCSAVGPSGTSDGVIMLHGLDSRQVRAELKGHHRLVRALCFSPDGLVLASGSDDLTIRLWDVSSGRCIGNLQGHKEDVFWLSFSPDGRMLASAGRGNDITLWDVDSRRSLATLAGHQDMVFSVCYHPDGHTLASGSRDQTVVMWDLTYYDRHIAGNLECQISLLPAPDRDNATIERLRTWAIEVLARPWPRPRWAN